MDSIPISAGAAATHIRISRIADHYLVFDHSSISELRRRHNISGTAAGTTPQQPQQNLFLGVPIELGPEEVRTLVDQGLAQVVDDGALQLAHLSTMGQAGRARYASSIQAQRRAAQQVWSEKKQAREQIGREIRLRNQAPQPGALTPSRRDSRSSTALTHMGNSGPSKEAGHGLSLTVTPTTGQEILPEIDAPDSQEALPSLSPMHRHLQSRGYYTTPGLRFGCRYSVYPGDPLRFHAHFLASEYSWDEPIPVLDIVSAGRLATGVKKAFLIGAEEPSEAGDGEQGEVRTFSIEWAAM